ncbi:Calcineurin-like phosphoesterase domain-containing protein [Madurella fahalii]|uniref:Calcineurin-like phosphoesterase domain-containing protein n=1 Tax=Madurella fahalii TaxID=1157608 RepID=A0ABQ0GD41_9PEZI
MVAFQILSDLHLEVIKEYDSFTIVPRAPYLALLGDIGAVGGGERHRDEFAGFLLRQLARFRAVFFVLGNHEPYRTDWAAARAFLAEVSSSLARQRREQEEATAAAGEEEGAAKTLGELVVLDRTRYDIDGEGGDKVAVLGCTLFSRIREGQEMEVVGYGLNDFHVIAGWTAAEHSRQHAEDVRWLNERVAEVEAEGKGRKVVIFTHHSPSDDVRATDPKHAGSKLAAGFRTDLKGEKCWTSEVVKLWAFGHTHYNCDFVDDAGVRVYSNQRGYVFAQAEGFDGERVVEV